MKENAVSFLETDSDLSEFDHVIRALRELRVPQALPEAELHRMVLERLDAEKIAYRNEAVLGPRRRIDILTDNGVGIELKIGRPDRKKLHRQLESYAASEKVRFLVVVIQKSVALSSVIGGKPCETVVLNKLWGIAL